MLTHFKPIFIECMKMKPDFYIKSTIYKAVTQTFLFYYLYHHLDEGISYLFLFVNRSWAPECCSGWAQEGDECTIRE